MRRVVWAALIALFALSGCATPNGPAYKDRSLAALASPRLERFSGPRELQQYADEVDRIRQRRLAAWRRNHDDDTFIVVTGSRIARPPSITNNQVGGVDEGDIVKRIGDYLLVLQDGRLFSTNFRTMELADRIDVYRRDEDGKPIAAEWYDEMLVQDDQIIVTAYSYDNQASEFTVFRIDRATGHLERRGQYQLSSNDYYDASNYATRVVGDNLVIYSPFALEELIDPNEAPTIGGVPDEETDSEAAPRDFVVKADQIFRPVFAVSYPSVHTVTICPLNTLDSEGLTCRSTGVIGDDTAEMFVDVDAIYIFVSQQGHSWYYGNLDCGEDNPSRARPSDVPLGAVFRMDFSNGQTSVLGVRGMPYSQFSFQQSEGRLRMLANWDRSDCDADWDLKQPVLFDVPIASFSQNFRAPSPASYVAVPDFAGTNPQIRYTDRWLVYGARENPEGSPLEGGEDYTTDNAVRVVNLTNPEIAQIIPLGHSLRRLALVGNRALVTGYSDHSGLNLSLLDFASGPKISARTLLDGVFGSEGRSHSFNLAPLADGSTIAALPTIGGRDEGDDHPARTETSDLTYFRFGEDGDITALGLLTRPEDRSGIAWEELDSADIQRDGLNYANGYHCEVSCVDWYGNSRPIFIEGGIYGLMGTDLVEAELVEGAISEIKRVDLTAKPQSAPQ